MDVSCRSELKRYGSHLFEVDDAVGCLQLKAEIDSSDEATILTNLYMVQAKRHMLIK